MTSEIEKKESEKLEEQQPVAEVPVEAEAEATESKNTENTSDKTSKEAKDDTETTDKAEEKSDAKPAEASEKTAAPADGAEEDTSDLESSEEDDEESSNKLEAPSISKEEFNDLRKDVRNIGQRKEWLFEVRSVVSKEIKSLFAMLKDLKESRDSLTIQVQSLKDEREQINVDIKGAISQIKSVQGAGSDKERVNVKKLKHELDKLQFYIETNPLSPDEEKKVMKQIKEKEKIIAKQAKIPVPEGDTKDLSQKINDLKDRSNEVHDKVQGNAHESQVKHESMISVSKEIKFLKAREKEIHNLFVETKSMYKERRRLLMQNRRFYLQPGSGKKKAPRKVSEKEAMKKVEENIQEKIKLGKKITTEDLLSFGK